MAWPYGISDPNLYAYIMNAAASLTQYPYGLPNSPSHLNYYASLGLQRAAAAYSPYGFPSPLRPRGELPLPGSPLIRPPTEPPHGPAHGPTSGPSTPTSLPCSLHPSRDPAAPANILSHSSSLLPPGAPPCTAAAGEPCNCHLFYSGLPSAPPTSLPAPTPIAAHAHITSLATSLPVPPTPPSLFQPYKTDVERA